eukprot:GHVO01053138.1.p1 GENE.GHVO01053138.1~~GHVO01053138.1.p1  ORF type:complete len:125 (+),score=18.23 GHVO01053138.1:167-541(+)
MSYKARSPWLQDPTPFPSMPLNTWDDDSFIKTLGTDTLFFIFHFQPGSQLQYMAARELKRQSWRYHTGQNAWFRRAEPPTESTDTYEKGNYFVFDYQTGWGPKAKTNFVFEYSNLEPEQEGEGN